MCFSRTGFPLDEAVSEVTNYGTGSRQAQTKVTNTNAFILGNKIIGTLNQSVQEWLWTYGHRNC